MAVSEGGGAAAWDELDQQSQLEARSFPISWIHHAISPVVAVAAERTTSSRRRTGSIAQRDEGPVEDSHPHAGSIDGERRQDGVELRTGKIGRPDKHVAIGGWRQWRRTGAADDRYLNEFEVWPRLFQEVAVVRRLTIDI